MTKSRGIRPHLARWTADQIAALIARYPHEKTDTIAADMGRSTPSTYGKAALLGLKKSPAFLASPDSGRTTGGIGQSSRFKGGLAPWNKGKHTFAGGRAVETQFKPGQAPVNHLPIGSVTVRRDRAGCERAWVKTAEPNVWRPRAICAWEAEHGPVPRGLVIHHRDRDTLNDTPPNLQALTRKEHADEHRGELLAARDFSHEKQLRGAAA